VSRYRVVLIDDEIPFVNSLGRNLEEDGYPVVRLGSIGEAIVELERLICACEADESHPVGTVDDRCWFVVVLDHDFPREEPACTVVGRKGEMTVTVGYDIAEWLRFRHPLGRLLPIIYLSGRETAQGFIARMRQNVQYHPDDFITKAEIGIDVDLLLNAIEHFDLELARLYSLSEEHGLVRGRYIFSDMFDE
jgi:CheY-like chemotaxis protein